MGKIKWTGVPLLLIIISCTQMLLNTENADSIFFYFHCFGAPSGAAPLCAAYSACIPTFCATGANASTPNGGRSRGLRDNHHLQCVFSLDA